MHDVGLEEYTLYKHAPACNEIVQEFYAHLQLAIGNQSTYSIGKGKEIPFTRTEILGAILIPDVPIQEPSFVDRVAPKDFDSFAPTSAIMASMRAF